MTSAPSWIGKAWRFGPVITARNPLWTAFAFRRRHARRSPCTTTSMTLTRSSRHSAAPERCWVKSRGHVFVPDEEKRHRGNGGSAGGYGAEAHRGSGGKAGGRGAEEHGGCRRGAGESSSSYRLALEQRLGHH